MTTATFTAGTVITCRNLPPMKRHQHIFIGQNAIDDNCRACAGKNIMFDQVTLFFMCLDCKQPIMSLQFYKERCCADGARMTPEL